MEAVYEQISRLMDAERSNRSTQKRKPPSRLKSKTLVNIEEEEENRGLSKANTLKKSVQTLNSLKHAQTLQKQGGITVNRLQSYSDDSIVEEVDEESKD